jgi:D-glycero-D-manno-heptose 1,7-bisphosphate phosphatase
MPPDPSRYVTDVVGFHILPEFIESLRVAGGLGYAAVIVTNQRGIGLGVVRRESVNRMHEVLHEVLRRESLSLLDILVCPYDDDAHPWRKPNPGMLLEAEERHSLDLAASWMIGDSERDVTAGARAACRTVRVASPAAHTDADFHLFSMSELPVFLERNLPGTETS